MNVRQKSHLLQSATKGDGADTNPCVKGTHSEPNEAKVALTRMDFLRALELWMSVTHASKVVGLLQA